MPRRLIPLLMIVTLLIAALPAAPLHAQDTDLYVLERQLGRGLVRSLAWSPAGDLIAVGGALGIWLYTPELDDVGRMTGHTKAIYDMAFSPDGSQLASVSHDMTVRIWDIASQTEQHTLEGHTDLVVAVDWSPDGSTVVSGAYDGTLRAWNPATGEALGVIGKHSGWVDDVAYNPAGTLLASVGHDGQLRVWDAATFAEIWSAEADPAGAQAVAWDNTGEQLVMVGRSGQLTVWDTTAHNPIWQIHAHDDVIYDVSWSGNTILTASWDGTIQEWNADGGEHLATFAFHTGRVQRVAFAPGRADLAASLGWDDTVRVWHPVAGTQLAVQDAHMDFINGLAWSDDGAHLIDVTLDGRAHIWEITSGVLIDTATGQLAGETTSTTTADGTRRAEIDAGGIVRIFDAVTGDLIMELPGRANAVSWRPDGKTLAVAVRNGTINLWTEQ